MLQQTSWKISVRIKGCSKNVTSRENIMHPLIFFFPLIWKVLKTNESSNMQTWVMLLSLLKKLSCLSASVIQLYKQLIFSTEVEMLDEKKKKKKQEHLDSPIAIRKSSRSTDRFQVSSLMPRQQYKNINLQQPRQLLHIHCRQQGSRGIASPSFINIFILVFPCLWGMILWLSLRQD